MNTQNTNRGGRRAGAGRKPSQSPRRSMTISVSPDTIKQANWLRNEGIKVNRLVEFAIHHDYIVHQQIKARRIAAEVRDMDDLEVSK